MQIENIFRPNTEGRIPTTIAYLRVNELSTASAHLHHYLIVKVGPDGMSLKYRRYSSMNAKPKHFQTMRVLDGEEYHAAVVLIIRIMRMLGPDLIRIAQYATRGNITSRPKA